MALQTFIAHLPEILLALATLIATLRNGRKVDGVHETVNSRMTSLLKETRAKGRAEGVDAAGGPDPRETETS